MHQPAYSSPKGAYFAAPLEEGLVHESLKPAGTSSVNYTLQAQYKS